MTPESIQLDKYFVETNVEHWDLLKHASDILNHNPSFTSGELCRYITTQLRTIKDSNATEINEEMRNKANSILKDWKMHSKKISSLLNGSQSLSHTQRRQLATSVPQSISQYNKSCNVQQNINTETAILSGAELRSEKKAINTETEFSESQILGKRDNYIEQHFDENNGDEYDDDNDGEEEISSDQEFQQWIDDNYNDEPVEVFTGNCNKLINDMSESSWKQYKNAYNQMGQSQKWKLNSGRFVEDVIYNHALKLKKEHSLHSFIIDTGDEYTQNNVKKLLNDLNKTNMKDINAILMDSTKRFQDFYTRRICHAVEELLFHYEANPNPLMALQLKQWYQSNVWCSLIDKFFGDINGVTCVRGESISNGSKERKRAGGSFSSSNKKKLGNRTDMIIRKSGNGMNLEYGVSEAGSRYEGSYGKKKMYDGELKLPKTLRDMFIMMCKDIKWDPIKMKSIEIIGYLHSGLVTEFMVLDYACGFVCRLRRSDYYEVPRQVEEFPRFLPLISGSIKMKERVLKNIQVLNSVSLDFDFNMMDQKIIKPISTLTLPPTLTTPPRPIKRRKIKKL